MEYIYNWISGEVCKPKSGLFLEKINPHSGKVIYKVANSNYVDVEYAVIAAHKAFDNWSKITPVLRGQYLSTIVTLLKENTEILSQCISIEAGKPIKDAKAEVNAAILQGEYWAGEGMRLYGRSLTSGIMGKSSFTIRQPIGIAGLIVPANTPIANIAWKVFPALICGNTIVLKAAEDSPKIAIIFAELLKKANLPNGVFNVVQGSGESAGSELVKNSRISLISFTGSTNVGRQIAQSAGQRLVRVSLELGGKNPMVICDDADLQNAVNWAILSAFSNAGQRCAATSRILVFSSVYEKFRELFVLKSKNLKLGISENSDLGPVINKKQHTRVLNLINEAVNDGGRILCGGHPPIENELKNGYYILPTIIEGLSPEAELNNIEIFGPVVTIQSVSNINEAVLIANKSEFGLTSAIHTCNIDRALWFVNNVRSGVANINLGTYGSEPHMPFGGFGSSGNGTREPGVEALDVYSELKNISVLVRENLI